ncbi:MAG: outer membrane beta-barrel protein [Mucilaginibacter sp.]|uniref:outer membrane beta-barrel protein n=1 Tax=Mucilaginibacter sp. TaxID=1882438 RepID=UPI003264FF40
MKKPLLILLIIISANLTFAQQVNFGLKLGISNSILLENYNGTTSSTGGINNVDIGAYADIKFGNFTVQPGLAYFLKGGGGGSSYTYSTSTGTATFYDQVLRLHYIELPVNALYNIPIKAGKFFIGAGPYVAYAVVGKSETFTSTSNSGTVTKSSTTDVTFGSGVNDLQRFDYGINVLGGFRFNNGLELGIAYGLGLQNLSNQPNFSAKNATGSINIGYFFK